MLKDYFYLVRLHKPIGIFLLLWPTLWALWLASFGHPDPKIVTIFILGVIIMRSAGCIINDFADRKWDGLVRRTANRPLATGKISVKNALLLFISLLLVALLLIRNLNPLVIHLAFLGVFFAVVYPFLKRYTHLPQVGLGLAFAWGIPMAFAAELNTVTFSGWILFFATGLWIIMYDTLYAMVDREEDISVGIKSSAILFARFDKLIIGILQICFLSLLIWIGKLYHLTFYYFSSLVAVSLLFFYQHLLIKKRDPVNCFKAFLNNHWVGLIIFIGIIL